MRNWEVEADSHFGAAHDVWPNSQLTQRRSGRSYPTEDLYLARRNPNLLVRLTKSG